MTLEEAQKAVDEWIHKYGVRYFSELTNMAVLTEEVGELARIMARKYGDQSFKEGEKDDISDEITDVLWSTPLHRKPDRGKPHRSICTKSGKENPKRQQKTYQ